MIYAAFTLWLFLLTFAGIGVYKLWLGLIGPRWVNWLLLPGTVVSEMAYIFGCLITGGEIRRARLIDFGNTGDGHPQTEAAPKLKTIGPLTASLMTVIACGAAILIVDGLLGESVVATFATSAGGLTPTALPAELPTAWAKFWVQAAGQLTLVRLMCETLGKMGWRQWQGPMFVYLAMCLSIRLTPVRRNLRATLGAVAVICALVALIGLVWRGFEDVLEQIWPLLTYIYATVLTVLAVTLVVRGAAALTNALRGKSPTRRFGSRSAGDE